jgi:ABC-2 type transport system ATP-binding protein
MSDVVVVEHLTKSYGKRRGVIDLSFTITAGEVFGYLGPNGAGKTTTIRTLMDFLRPTAGRVSVFELDSRAGAIDIHRRTGYLPGEFGLYGRFTALDYLMFLASLRGGIARARIQTLAGRLGLDLSVRMHALSHGNKQKVGLVQAFMHEPELMILDEPTQGLDPLVQQEFYALLHEARDAGRTVLLSSHVMPEVERVCDRVGIIRDGRLAAIEDIGELKAKAFRMLEVRLAQPVPASEYETIPGVRDVVVTSNHVHFTVTGPLDPVIKALARFEVEDLVSHEPSLEDVFLAFYGQDESDAA